MLKVGVNKEGVNKEINISDEFVLLLHSSSGIFRSQTGGFFVSTLVHFLEKTCFKDTYSVIFLSNLNLEIT